MDSVNQNCPTRHTCCGAAIEDPHEKKCLDVGDACCKKSLSKPTTGNLDLDRVLAAGVEFFRIKPGDVVVFNSLTPLPADTLPVIKEKLSAHAGGEVLVGFLCATEMAVLSGGTRYGIHRAVDGFLGRTGRPSFRDRLRHLLGW